MKLFRVYHAKMQNFDLNHLSLCNFAFSLKNSEIQFYYG